MTYNIIHIQELIIEKIAGTISEDDDYLLERAIKENNDIRALWQEMQETLTTDRAVLFINNLDENKAWDKIENKLGHIEPVNLKRNGYVKWMSIAALFFIAFVTILIYYRGVKPTHNVSVVNNNYNKKIESAVELKLANGQHINLSDTSKRLIKLPFAQIKKGANGLSYKLNDDNAEEWSTLTVPSKLDYQIVLADGTQVWLNSASSLRFPFSFIGKTREVYLTGEAFFKVTKNQAQPFIVHTGQTDIKVLGTEFNVNTYSASVTATSLVEGSVYTNNHYNQDVLLTPGNQAIYSQATGFIKQPFDANTELAWMQGIYYFHNAKLNDISHVLLRWFGLNVVFDDPAKAEESLSGAINKNKPIQVFLKNLKASADVETSLNGDVLHIK